MYSLLLIVMATVSTLPWELRREILWTVGLEYKAFMSAVCREWRELCSGMSSLTPYEVVCKLCMAGDEAVFQRMFELSSIDVQHFQNVIGFCMHFTDTLFSSHLQSDLTKICKWIGKFASEEISERNINCAIAYGVEKLVDDWFIPNLNYLASYENIAYYNSSDEFVRLKVDWLLRHYPLPDHVTLRTLPLIILVQIHRSYLELPEKVPWTFVYNDDVNVLDFPLDDLKWMHEHGYKINKNINMHHIKWSLMHNIHNKNPYMLNYCDALRAKKKWIKKVSRTVQ